MHSGINVYNNFLMPLNVVTIFNLKKTISYMDFAQYNC